MYYFDESITIARHRDQRGGVGESEERNDGHNSEEQDRPSQGAKSSRTKVEGIIGIVVVSGSLEERVPS